MTDIWAGKGYSPLRRWLRLERARDHEAWLSAERCPRCGEVATHGVMWGLPPYPNGWRCANQHQWWHNTAHTATYVEGPL